MADAPEERNKRKVKWRFKIPKLPWFRDRKRAPALPPRLIQLSRYTTSKAGSPNLVTTTPCPDTPNTSEHYDIEQVFRTPLDEPRGMSAQSPPQMLGPLLDLNGIQSIENQSFHTSLDEPYLASRYLASSGETWENDYSTVTDDSITDEFEFNTSQSVTEKQSNTHDSQLSSHSTATSELSIRSIQRMLQTENVQVSNVATFGSVMLGKPYPLLGELVTEYLTPSEVGRLVLLCVDAAAALSDCELRLDQLQYRKSLSPSQFATFFPRKATKVPLQEHHNHHTRRRINWMIRGIRLRDSPDEETKSLEDYLNVGILNPRMLTFLSLSIGSQVTDISPLSTCINLTELQLQCPLEGIEVVSSLHKLRNLSVSDSVDLVSISGIGKLKHLDQLSISRCYHLEDLSPLGNGVTIDTICLDECWAIYDISVFGKGSPLKYQTLVVEECEGIVTMPRPAESARKIRFSNCSHFQVLEVDETSDDHNSTIQELNSSSKYLDVTIDGCSILQHVGALFSWKNLRNVKILNCPSIISLGDIYGLQHPSLTVSELCIEECKGLCSLEGLDHLSSLSFISCRFGAVSQLASLGISHEFLTKLDLSYSKHLVDIHPLAMCSSLHQLDLNYCTSLCDISPISNMGKLEHLSLISSNNVLSLQPLQYCVSLTFVNVQFLDKITSTQGLAECKLLNNLNLGYCTKLVDIKDLQFCESLEFLNLCGTAVENLHHISKLPNLSLLNLSWMPYITDLSPVLDLPNLTDLDLQSMPKIYTIAAESLFRGKQINIVI